MPAENEFFMLEVGSFWTLRKEVRNFLGCHIYSLSLITPVLVLCRGGGIHFLNLYVGPVGRLLSYSTEMPRA